MFYLVTFRCLFAWEVRVMIVPSIRVMVVKVGSKINQRGNVHRINIWVSFQFQEHIIPITPILLLPSICKRTSIMMSRLQSIWLMDALIREKTHKNILM